MVYNLTSKQDFGSNRFSAYVQDTYRLTTEAGYFTLNGGVRLSYWDFNDELLISPRASVGFVPKGNATQIYVHLYYNKAEIDKLQVQSMLSVGLTYTFKNK